MNRLLALMSFALVMLLTLASCSKDTPKSEATTTTSYLVGKTFIGGSNEPESPTDDVYYYSTIQFLNEKDAIMMTYFREEEFYQEIKSYLSYTYNKPVLTRVLLKKVRIVDGNEIEEEIDEEYDKKFITFVVDEALGTITERSDSRKPLNMRLKK